MSEDESIVGFLNISEIVRGKFQSAFLGDGAAAEFAGRGYLDRAQQAMRIPARGLLLELPRGRRTLARPRAVGYHEGELSPAPGFDPEALRQPFRL